MKATTLRFYKERLLRVLVHIQQRLDEPLALDELARLAGFSPYHFHHVFRGMLGESLAGHVRRLRLERAAWRLKLSGTPVVQLALEAGYESHEAFSRAFRNSFGVSPTQFRRRHQALLRIPASSGVHYRSAGTIESFRSKRRGDAVLSVIIVKLEPVRVAFMRHLGPYHEVGNTWEQLTLLLGRHGWLGGDTRFFGICHDDPAVTPPDRIRYDACVTVNGKFRAAGEIGVQTIPGGDYAVMTHLGPYERLGDSYAKLLGQWIPRSGRELRLTPCFEEYFNSPADTAPEELITDINAPLQTKCAATAAADSL